MSEHQKPIDTTNHDQEPSEVKTAVPSNLYFKPSTLNAAQIYYSEIAAKNLNNNATHVLGSSSSKVLFELPVDVLADFSKSCLRFDMLLTSVATNNITTKVWMHKPPIESIRVVTPSGPICELPEFQYQWLATRQYVSRDQYLVHGAPGIAATVANARAQGNFLKFDNPSGRPNTVTLGALIPNSSKITSAGALEVLGTQAGEGARMVVASATAGNDSTGSDIAFACEISFSQIVGSLLACPFALPLTEKVTIEVTFTDKTKAAFADEAKNNSATIATAPKTYAGTATLSNVNLYLAIDKNELNLATAKDIVAAGNFNVCVPRSILAKQQLSASGQAQHTLSTGTSLLRIISLEFNTEEDLNVAWNAANHNGVKVSAFRSSINGKNWEENEVTVAELKDLQIMRPWLAGSPVDPNEYYYLPAYCINFSGVNRAIDCAYSDFHHVSGIPVPSNFQFARKLTVSRAVNNITIFVVQDFYNFRPGKITMLDSNQAPIRTPVPKAY